MSDLTNYGAAAIAAGTAIPQTLWIKFHTGAPGPDADQSAAVETTRKSVDLEEGLLPNIATNDADAVWTGLAANETANYASLWDAATVGNPWFTATINLALTLVLSGSATVEAGNLRITIPIGT